MRNEEVNVLQFVNIIRDNIYKNKLLKPEEKILVTISGGQDSICLLLILYLLQTQLTFKFDCIWCHHFWQRSSFFTMLHVTKYTYSLSSKIILVLPLKKVLSEQSARDWRYQIIERTSLFHKYSVCTQAHSKTDRIETILFNLFRGSGMAGISALRWKRIQSFSYSNKFYPGFSQFIQNIHASFFNASEFEIPLRDEKMLSQLPIYISQNKFSPEIEMQTQEFLLSDQLINFKNLRALRARRAAHGIKKKKPNSNQLNLTNFHFFRNGTFPFKSIETTENFKKNQVKSPVPYQMVSKLKTILHAEKGEFSHSRIKKSQLFCTTCYYQLKHITL